MNLDQPKMIQLENDYVLLNIDPLGGAISSFRLKEENINPLSFSFSKEQMPFNNKAGANYKGHFLCLGRWGEPSAGEIKAGLPNHGEPANIQWTIKETTKAELRMETIATKEGLHVERTIVVDPQSSVYGVKENVTNINPLGRLFNMVQHPTLAAPFLDEKTIVDCNATKGFDQMHYKNISSNIVEWPIANDIEGNRINLKNPASAYSSVYSFIVNPLYDYGWITALSPKHNLLFGYIWKREHYPWINLWQHYNENKIQYRGLEFGTTGIHQPFEEILNTATTLFDRKTYAYIDAGETITKSYFSFISAIPKDFKGVENVDIVEDKLIIRTSDNNEDIIFKLSQNLIHGLSE